MKTLTLITALSMVLSGAALAQQAAPTPDSQAPAAARHHRAPDAAKETARMAKTLNLTSDQSAQIEPLLSDRDAKIAAITNNSALSAEDRTEQIKAVRKETNSKVRAVLTPEQLQQMKDARKNHEHGAADAPPPPPTN
ncbi:MAG: hypothetical protein ABI142_09410 [Bryocella sp.]